MTQKKFPVPPYRLVKLVGQPRGGRIWQTVKRARPAVAERVYLMMLQDGAERRELKLNRGQK